MPATKRDQILSAADALFYHEGFHATGIDRVVAEAGVVRMTLYNHFRAKDELVLAVLDRRQERFLASLDAADAAAAAGEATMALVDGHGAWVAAHNPRGCTFMKALGEYGAHSPAIRDRALAAKQALYRRIDLALARDGLGDVPGLATRIFMALEGSYAAILTIGPEAAVREARTSVAALLAAAGEGS